MTCNEHWPLTYEEKYEIMMKPIRRERAERLKKLEEEKEAEK